MKYWIVPAIMLVMMACNVVGGKMQINNPPDSVPYVQDVSNKRIYCKLIDIGLINMSAVSSKTIVHGISGAIDKIIAVTGGVRNDAGDLITGLSNLPTAIPDIGNSIEFALDATNITLAWSTTGWYGMGNYNNNTTVNRGYILIWFVE